MSRWLTAEMQLDIPFSADSVVAALRTLFDGSEPVTTRTIASALHGDVTAVESALWQAEHAHLIKHVHGKGWIPLAK